MDRITPFLYKKNLLPLLFLFLFTGNLSAQKINLNVKNESLSGVFISITKQTGIRFSYNPQIIDAREKISVKVNDKEIDEVLKIILPSSVSYRQIDKHIILSLNEETAELSKNTTVGEKKGKDSDLIFREEENNFQNNLLPDNGDVRDDCLNNITLKNEEEMKAYLAAVLMGTAVTTSQVSAQDSLKVETTTIEQEKETKIKPFQGTFIYPLGTDGANSVNNKYKFSLNILGGVTKGVQGCELASGFNITTHEARGTQIAGGFNMAGLSSKDLQPSNNVQIAAGFNTTLKGRSSQFSGGFNLADTGVVQATAGINIAKESYTQISGGVNVSEKNKAQLSAGVNMAEVSSFQITGGLNMAEEGNTQLSAGINMANESKCQITGGLNLTKKGNTQMSAGLNIANESKCQIVGGINITKKGGFQLGILNIRDTADGVSVGILNIVKRGGVMEVGIEGGEFNQTSVTFRSGTRHFYSYLSLGRGFTNDFWSAGVGFGTSFVLKNKLGLNLELVHYNLTDKPFWGEEYEALIQFRPLLNFEIAKHFKIYVGPSFNYYFQTDMEAPEMKVPYHIYEKTTDNIRSYGWIGVTGGIKF